MDYQHDERKAFERAGGGGVFLDLKKPEEFWVYKVGLILDKYAKDKKRLLDDYIADIPSYELLNPFGFVFAWMCYDEVTILNESMIEKVKVFIKKNSDDHTSTPLKEILDVLDVVRYVRMLHRIKKPNDEMQV